MTNDHPEALELNAERNEDVLALFLAGSIEEQEVSAKYPHLHWAKLRAMREHHAVVCLVDNDKQSIHYPKWQFNEVGLRDELPEIMRWLRINQVASDVAADRIIRWVEHDELGEMTTILDVLDSDDLDLQERAWQILENLGDGHL